MVADYREGIDWLNNNGFHLVNQLTEMDKDSFIGAYNQWNIKWETFLKESRIDDKTKRKVYIHKRLRSANHSLKINMKYLWTWYDNIDLNIPNTNNSLEGYFKHLKAYLNSHSGLSKEHCSIFIDKYIAKEYEQYPPLRSVYCSYSLS